MQMMAARFKPLHAKELRKKIREVSVKKIVRIKLPKGQSPMIIQLELNQH
jgi:hypothetical protein